MSREEALDQWRMKLRHIIDDLKEKRRQQMSDEPTDPDEYDTDQSAMTPKRPRRETLFSRIDMANLHTALGKLTLRWLNTVPFPAPTLDEAYKVVMTPHEWDILDEATRLSPSTVSRTPHSSLIIPTSAGLEMEVMFLFKLMQGRYVPERVLVRDDHAEMPIMQEIVAYAEHKANVTRNMTVVWHLIQYLNLAVSTLRQLRIIWPDFAGIVQGMEFKGGTGKDWVPRFQENYRRLTPSSTPPEMFLMGQRYINDARGYVATTQLAVEVEPSKPDPALELQINRAWSSPDVEVPWHDEIHWGSVDPSVMSQTMQWLLR